MLSTVEKVATLALGSGYRMVRPSLVCRYGTPLGPVETALTWESVVNKVIVSIVTILTVKDYVRETQQR